jgi:lipopolysaccharide export LptBFGC system permease protein LptF
MEGIFIALLITAVSFVIGFVLAPYLNKKGYLNENNTNLTKQLLEISEIVLKNADVKNKDVAVSVLEISKSTVNYVEQTAKYEDNEVKKKLAKESVIEVLKSLNIEITEDTLKLIEIGIEGAVISLPKTW